ncbi:MAG: hypothetical protein ACRCZP_05030, partial [Phycicoccus sp.]
DGPEAVAAGLAAVDAALASPGTADHPVDHLAGGSVGTEAVTPRTLGSAVRSSGAPLALVSVPGQYAVVETLDALAAGASVMLFSDNVSVAHEVLLKDVAGAADLLVMGPDCGTAVVGGVALGFANAVRPGSIGLVAASGTGAQQVMCLLDAAGLGVSHCLGVGGRDLSAAVGGRSTRQALRALAADPATESVVVVSKPPDPEVLGVVEADAAALGLRVHWAVLGTGRPDLTAAVETVLDAEGRSVPEWPRWPESSASQADRASTSGSSARGSSLRGLFCGGTLAEETLLVAGAALGPVRSNVGGAARALGPDLHGAGHVVVDFGADELTRGRAHPMIDPTL